MSGISGISSNSPAYRTDSPARGLTRPAPVEVQIPTERVDTVDLSEQARLVDLLKSGGDVREDVVARVRGEIERGGYDTDEKLDRALDAMIDEILG
ncbi:MAG: flagellar biosynthesis anti-sigma factor FlgM [Planctomycetota bacterium]|nr:flagellar biosynthesis anti-sigma factor FlgM [Planctomycetota bacterium]